VHGHSASVLSDGAGDLNRSVRSSSVDSRMQVSVLQTQKSAALVLIAAHKESCHNTAVEE
jgi:hypothetical protein